MQKADLDPRTDFELALCLTPDLGSKGIARILARNAISDRTPEEFFALSEATLQEEYGLSQRAAAFLASGAPKLASAVMDLKRRLSGKPVALVTIQNPLYPKRLEEFCDEPPGYLFMYGNTKALSRDTFAVLASRDADGASLARVEKEAESGVLASRILVTGANTPSYQRAAVVPLRWGAPRVLVLDRGLFAALGDELDKEPFPAARLWRYKFDPLTDLAISCFRPDDHFPRGGDNNRRRDELVAALADEIRLVHARPGGNMERLAARAAQVGRRVIRVSGAD